MITFLIAISVFILIGLPALLLISACMAASRTTQREEYNRLTAEAAVEGFEMKSRTIGEQMDPMRETSITPDPFLQAVER